MEFIGIDVHKRDSQVCILSAEGEPLLEKRIRTESGRFAELLGSRPKARILVEASTESEWVARCLEGEDGQARCPDAGRRVPSGRLPPGPPSLG